MYSFYPASWNQIQTLLSCWRPHLSNAAKTFPRVQSLWVHETVATLVPSRCIWRREPDKHYFSVAIASWTTLLPRERAPRAVIADCTAATNSRCTHRLLECVSMHYRWARIKYSALQRECWREHRMTKIFTIDLNVWATAASYPLRLCIRNCPCIFERHPRTNLTLLREAEKNKKFDDGLARPGLLLFGFGMNHVRVLGKEVKMKESTVLPPSHLLSCNRDSNHTYSPVNALSMLMLENAIPVPWTRLLPLRRTGFCLFCGIPMDGLASVAMA